MDNEILYKFFDYVDVPTFDISSDAFLTFRVGEGLMGDIVGGWMGEIIWYGVGLGVFWGNGVVWRPLENFFTLRVEGGLYWVL